MTARISRRELLAWLAAGTGAAATGTSVFLGGSTPSPSANPAPTDTSARRGVRPSTTSVTSPPPPRTTGAVDRMLVVIEMPGGNDGLSMAVPYGQSVYYDRRVQTAIAQADVLRIDDEIGLHPNLTRLHARGISLVEGVGSTAPDGSHFEMQARWWAGSSQAGPATTGWVGRLADLFSADLSNAGAIPAAALSVGSGSHPIIRSATGSTLSLPSADAVWAMAGADPEDTFRSSYQRALRSFAGGSSAHATTMGSTLDFAEALALLDNETDTEALGYEGDGLGQSLPFTAQVLAGGTGVRVMHVSMSGDFDTHEGHAWRHPELMRELDTNLAAFHDDLDQRGIGDSVMVMTTSEFGRTLSENASGGLDHGTASTVLLSGPGTGDQLGWRHGTLPSLTDLDDNDDVKATVPLEEYLGGVVEGWLGVPATEVFAASTPMTFDFPST